MTLKELSNANLFPGSTKIFLEGHNGSTYWIKKMDYKATISNCMSFFNDTFLNKEIQFVQPYEYDVILVIFKGE